MKIMFFPNGYTAVFKDGRQITELEESWFMLYIQLIAVYGIDPTETEFVMPDGNRAEVMTLEDGSYGWQIRLTKNQGSRSMNKAENLGMVRRDEEFEKWYQDFTRKYSPIIGKTWTKAGWVAAWEYLADQVAEQTAQPVNPPSLNKIAMTDRYPMCKDQLAQIDCRIEDCRFYVASACANISPAITLNPDHTCVCWSFERLHLSHTDRKDKED